MLLVYGTRAEIAQGAMGNNFAPVLDQFITTHQDLDLALETPGTAPGVSTFPSTERLATGWP